MPVRPKIRAVTFDVGGTLIDPWPSVGHVYAQVAAENGMTGVEPEHLNRGFAAAWKTKGNFNHSKAGWSALVSRTFYGDTKPLREVEFFEKLYARFVEPDVWRIHEDVLPAIERLLRYDLKLAVVSNWDERLRPLLKALKLDSYFDTMAISSEIGFGKPSPVIFEEAVRKLAVLPEEVLHVGDSVIEDVEGASTAGLQVVLIDRKQRENNGKAVTNLLKLESLLF